MTKRNFNFLVREVNILIEESKNVLINFASLNKEQFKYIVELLKGNEYEPLPKYYENKSEGEAYLIKKLYKVNVVEEFRKGGYF